MDSKILIGEVVIELPITITTGNLFHRDPTVTTQQMGEINRALCKFHVGVESLSRDPKEEPKSTKELDDALHSLHATHLKKIRIKIYSDGSLKHEFVD